MSNAGLALPSTGLRLQAAAAVKQDIRQLMVDAVHDKVGHAEAVAGGRQVFRDVFWKQYSPAFGNHRGPCDTLADVVWQFLQAAWREKYPGESANQFLDSVHIASPLSAKEEEEQAEAAWVVDIESSQEAFELYYRGDARRRTGREAFSTAWQRSPDEIKKRLKARGGG